MSHLIFSYIVVYIRTPLQFTSLSETFSRISLCRGTDAATLVSVAWKGVTGELPSGGLSGVADGMCDGENLCRVLCATNKKGKCLVSLEEHHTKRNVW